MRFFTARPGIREIHHIGLARPYVVRSSASVRAGRSTVGDKSEILERQSRRLIQYISGLVHLVIRRGTSAISNEWSGVFILIEEHERRDCRICGKKTNYQRNDGGRKNQKKTVRMAQNGSNSTLSFPSKFALAAHRRLGSSFSLYSAPAHLQTR